MPVNSSRAVRQLGLTLDRLFGNPRVGSVIWGVDIRSLDRDESLYSLNARALLVPASTMKIATLAAAAERLSWDFRYETELLTSTPVDDGVLAGDLIIRGTGDPTINVDTRPGNSLFDQWARELRAMGIQRIGGRIIGDDDALDGGDTDPGLGAGWSWDDLGLGFAAPAGALQYHENVVQLKLSPGPREGMPGTVLVDDRVPGLRLVNEMMTVSQDGALVVRLLRPPGLSALVVTGTIPAGTAPIQRTAAVDNPTIFFVRALRETLEREGIAVVGDAVDIDDLATSAHDEFQGKLRRLAAHQSVPLSALAVDMMKRSQNLYAETVLRTLGARTGGVATSGPQAVADILASWNIGKEQAIVADGSGLSRYNCLTAGALVQILRRMHADPRHATYFRATLPVAGRDGTLSGRMMGTAAEGNAQAKTGSMTQVRTLSGYVETLDGEQLAFAILANNFHVPPAEVVSIIDSAVDTLATFSR